MWRARHPGHFHFKPAIFNIGFAPTQFNVTPAKPARRVGLCLATISRRCDACSCDDRAWRPARCNVSEYAMFPNIRLTIVALLASVVGIGCGLAMFAAFRVNREPFAHSSNGGAPLQLVFAVPAPTMADRTDRIAVPFGVRFAVNAISAGSVSLNRENAASAAPTAKDAASEVAVQSPASQAPPTSQAAPASAAAPDAKTDVQAHVARHRPARARRIHRRQAATAAPPDGQLPQPATFGSNIR